MEKGDSAGRGFGFWGVEGWAALPGVVAGTPLLLFGCGLYTCLHKFMLASGGESGKPP
ncbi:MAG: hypothetical protein Q6367_001515 [Candidatus Freyarchaeota archaeon]